MKYFLSLLAAGSMCCSTKITADERLLQLAHYDKLSCAELLRETDFDTLYASFIQGQTDLYFDHEVKFLESEDAWRGAKNVLEVGSRNGYFLYRLSKTFPDKTFVGVEAEQTCVEQANLSYGHSSLTFEQENSEFEIEAYKDKFDVIIFRLALQRSKSPLLVLEHASHYLKKGGSIIIIEAYDAARRSSHEIFSLTHPIQLLNSQNVASYNRKCSFEVLNELQQKESTLSRLFTLVRSSLDAQGLPVEEGICFKSEIDRKRLFNHGLLFLSLLDRKHGIPADYLTAYEELQVYLTDNTSWASPGAHLLILQKNH